MRGIQKNMAESMGFMGNMVSVNTLAIAEAAIVFLRILLNIQEHLFFIENSR